MFGSTKTTAFSGASSFGTFGSTSATTNTLGLGTLDNPMKDIEVQAPPDDTIRCWEVKEMARPFQRHNSLIQVPSWIVAGMMMRTKVFTASTDKQCKMWDLNFQPGRSSGTDIVTALVWDCLDTAKHDKGSQDLSLGPAPKLQLSNDWKLGPDTKVLGHTVTEPHASYTSSREGVLCRCGVPMAMSELHREESLCEYFRDPKKNNSPVGFALGSVEGRVAIKSLTSESCIFCLLSTVGSDGKFSFWDKDARTKLKTSEQLNMSITACCFNSKGNIFAYSSSYDWSKGHEYFNPQAKPKIFLRNCTDELKPEKSEIKEHSVSVTHRKILHIKTTNRSHSQY
ncbi:Poly(A)+ RNA export protein rae1 [Desmophyllum pertusum]|uniref:Poly(A)+ RNA export protein rae1 n=1 Tax=Desmophyllum pertusum TaxID=174260 RepID=A0A9X0CTI2_9CNID|nr:Poly(A)+ RNA export protein rae1 [Desmophyllum pertusum]